MAITKANLRLGLSKEIGDDFVSATTASGSTTTFKDAALNMVDASAFLESWVLWTSGTAANIGKVVRITSVDDTVSPAVATFTPAITATASGDGYEIHRVFHPRQKSDALNEARILLSNRLYLPLENESLITHNPLLNSDFETWTVATVPDSWAKSVITCAANTTYVLHGTNSAALTHAGNGYIEQTITQNELLRAAREHDISFYAWVLASTASQARLAINDGTTVTTGDYHTGNGTWQLLSVEASIATGASAVGVRVQVNAAGTCYVDSAWAEGAWAIYDYALPSAFYDAPDRVSLQPDNTLPPGENTRPYITLHPWEYSINSETRTLRLSQNHSAGRRIRLNGRGLLTAIATDTISTVSTDTGTMEVSEPQVRLLYAYAAMQLFAKVRQTAIGVDADRYRELEQAWGNEVTVRSRGFQTVKSPKTTITRSGWTIH